MERRVVRQRRIAAHAVVVLHAALGRQAVVVPPHRIEHRLAAHALKARDEVGVREREDVADVQRSADGRRRRVDRKHLRRGLRPVEPVDALIFPPRRPPGPRGPPARAFQERASDDGITDSGRGSDRASAIGGHEPLDTTEWTLLIRLLISSRTAARRFRRRFQRTTRSDSCSRTRADNSCHAVVGHGHAWWRCGRWCGKPPPGTAAWRPRGLRAPGWAPARG